MPNVTLVNSTAAPEVENVEWITNVRFAIEGVTQGIVGLIGLVGEFTMTAFQISDCDRFLN